MQSENILQKEFKYYPFEYLERTENSKYPRDRFVIFASAANTGAVVEYIAEFTRFLPHFYNVSLYPRQWQKKPDRFQNFLCKETENRIDFQLLIRSCTRIFSRHFTATDPLALAAVRGEYTRMEYRQKKTHGFSRKTAVYRYVLKHIAAGENLELHQFPENNLLLLCACGNPFEPALAVKEFEAYSSSCSEEDSEITPDRQPAADVFVLPAGSRFNLPNEDLLLIYAPLAGKSTLAASTPEFSKDDPIGAALLERELPQALPQTPEEYFSCIIIPTSSCNFSCSYCYAAGGHSAAHLSEEDLLSALRFLVRTPKQKYTLLFSGGGEPLLCKKLIRTYSSRGSCGGCV